MSLDSTSQERHETVSYLCTAGKGILAADESSPTMTKRFDLFGVDNTYHNRMNYRSTLLGTQGLEQYLSGVIINEDTLNNIQIGADYYTLLQSIDTRFIIGCKLDQGITKLPGSIGHHGETATRGLDSLYERACGVYDKGVRFAKWRNQILIPSNNDVSSLSLSVVAYQIAYYTRIVQEAGLVAIIEPEVLYKGAHSIDTTYSVMMELYSNIIHQLHQWGCDLSTVILKPSYCMSGSDWSWAIHKDPGPCRTRSIITAEYTLKVLQDTIPPVIPGIFFLSGGLSEEESSILLSTINTIKTPTIHPWQLSFSYGRALQQSALRHWSEGNTKASQEMILSRSKANSEAVYGTYNAGSESSSYLPINEY